MPFQLTRSQSRAPSAGPRTRIGVLEGTRATIRAVVVGWARSRAGRPSEEGAILAMRPAVAFCGAAAGAGVAVLVGTARNGSSSVARAWAIRFASPAAAGGSTPNETPLAAAVGVSGRAGRSARGLGRDGW